MTDQPVYKSRFEAIEVLRFPLMILVVFNHVLPFELQKVKLLWDADALFTLFSELISHHLGRLAVPCFFLFSGYFFFLKIQRFDMRTYGKQLARRCSSLLLPYFLWNIFFIAAVLVKNLLTRHLGLAADELYVQLENRSWYDLLWKGPFLFPFWYLRDLICMTILSPVFYLLFKFAKGFGLILLVALYLLVWNLNVPGLGTTAFLFYGTGVFLGLYGYDLERMASRYKGLKLTLALSFLGVATYFGGTSNYEFWIRLFIISGVGCMLSLGYLLCRTAWLKPWLLTLSSTVFFIYALHGIYIINWLKGGFARSAAFNQDWGRLAAYFIIPVVCLLVCYGLYSLMKRHAPYVLAVLTGGRVIVQPLTNGYGR